MEKCWLYFGGRFKKTFVNTQKMEKTREKMHTKMQKNAKTAKTFFLMYNLGGDRRRTWEGGGIKKPGDGVALVFANASGQCCLGIHECTRTRSVFLERRGWCCI